MWSSTATCTSATTGAPPACSRPAGRRSTGLPYETQPGAYWAIFGPDVEHRRTEYDYEGMIDAARALGFPRVDEYAQPSLVEPIGPDAASEHFEQMARGA